MSLSSSNVARKPADVVPDEFPAGLRVLVVDDDPTCLMILEKMLRNCLYEVTKCNRAEFALSLLRENKNGFDIVISDVHMPDMDGFKLLEHIGLEMDLPVIMMSADDSKSVVMKGVTHGACDYLIKPVRIEALRNIWQHFFRKKRNEWKDFEAWGSVVEDIGEKQQKLPEDAIDYSSSANEENWKNSKRRKEGEDEIEERDDSSSMKKPRVVWSVELHQQFVAAVSQLGIEKSVPKKILELMNVPGLTRENVASHLQKYRLYLRRLSGSQQSGLHNSLMGTQEPDFGSLSSLNGLDLQALAASGQIPAQSLATLQAAAFGRPTGKSAVSVPLMEQKNIFSFENPNKQVNFLHGIPTNMEPKQLANLHQLSNSFGPMSNQLGPHISQTGPLYMGQTLSRPQILNENNAGHLSRQPISENGVRNSMLPLNGNLDFSMRQNTESIANFPIRGSTVISILAPRGVIQDFALETRGFQGGMPSGNFFNGLDTNKLHDLGLQNLGTNFGTLCTNGINNNVQRNLGVIPPVLLQQSFSFNQKMVQNSNSFIGAGQVSGQMDGSNLGQHMNFGDSSLKIKPEVVQDGSLHSNMFSERLGQEDLMTILLKQQGVGPAEHEFGFDNFHLDNLPV